MYVAASATVTIMVEDINNHAPRFTQKLYRTTMSENLPVDASIISVSATDADVGQYAKLTYSLKEEDRQFFSMFSVEATNTGVLKVFRVRDGRQIVSGKRYVQTRFKSGFFQSTVTELSKQLTRIDTCKFGIRLISVFV